MGRIHLLEDVLSNQIAAGEVVERPASVVKELVENAVDAGATQVTIEIAGGGVDKIRIVDNGHGMDRDDVAMCLQRHATSKLRVISDLDSLATLGFRGEAIPSIASVSRLSIRTREQKAVGAIRLTAVGGSEVALQDAGGPVGTEFLIEDLFFNVPARRKFLKTAATEASHIQEIAQRVALCYPSIAVRFIKDGRQVFDYPQCGGLRERIGAVFGTRVAERLTEVSVPGAFGLDGYVGAAEDAKSTPRHYHIFINGRFVRDRVVMSAIQSAYGSALPRGKHPLVVLRLTLPAMAVDVNVHPAKTEVRFSDSRSIHRLVARSIDGALRARAETEKAPTEPGAGANSASDTYRLPTRSSTGAGLDQHRDRIFQAMERMATRRAGPPTRRSAPRREDGQLPLPTGRPREPEPPAPPSSRQARTAAGPQGERQPSRLPLEAGTRPGHSHISDDELVSITNSTSIEPSIISKVRNVANVGAYTVFSGLDGLIAFHRGRVLCAQQLYEMNTNVPGAEYVPPVSLDLRPEERKALDSLGATLEAAGVEVEPFGGSTYLVKKGPPRVDGPEVVQMVREVLKSPEKSWSVRMVQEGLAERSSRRHEEAATPNDIREALVLLAESKAPLDGLGFPISALTLQSLDR